ncbi:hypothetical protein ACH5RR_025442 [Cinchona calisaya]|uniref:Uncharacterized protein n=1 Tax=Cinchona calisaya TaxID=153742 RepID=A0ABD2Z310_9GENT
MAVDFWAAKVHSAKHILAVQAARLNNSESHLTMDDEGEDDVRACFPCPFCSVEFLMVIQNEPAPDPLLSPFLCSATFSDPKDYKQDVSCTFADSSANAESSIVFAYDLLTGINLEGQETVNNRTLYIWVLLLVVAC